jgi:hypothetical protein
VALMTRKMDAARRALAAATAAKEITIVPSRAALARRWPKLRVNRLTYQWIDEASGERGYSQSSLLAFLNGARSNGES